MKQFLFGLGAAALAGAAAAQSRELEKPVRLEAGGVVIDTGKYIAHAGPLLANLDGDGVRDLLVGNFKGHFQVYRNIGTAREPKLEDKGLLQADGETVLVHNW